MLGSFATLYNVTYVGQRTLIQPRVQLLQREQIKPYKSGFILSVNSNKIANLITCSV